MNAPFVDRQTELAFLNRVLANRQHPGPGQFAILVRSASYRKVDAPPSLGRAERRPLHLLECREGASPGAAA